MTEELEWVSSSTVPRDLAIRLAAGQALEILIFFSDTGEMPDGGHKVLSAAAQELRPPAGALQQTAGNSISDSADAVPLFAAAAAAFNADTTARMFQQLNSVAEDLQRLAEEQHVAPERVLELIRELDQIRSVIADSRSIETDEPVSNSR